MNNIFVILLIVILIFIYFLKQNIFRENFKSTDNIYQSINMDPLKKNIIQSPYSTEPNVDYQAYLNSISGYDGATRSYSNPFYAQQIASGLDTN